MFWRNRIWILSWKWEKKWFYQKSDEFSAGSLRLSPICQNITSMAHRQVGESERTVFFFFLLHRWTKYWIYLDIFVPQTWKIIKILDFQCFLQLRISWFFNRFQKVQKIWKVQDSLDSKTMTDISRMHC